MTDQPIHLESAPTVMFESILRVYAVIDRLTDRENRDDSMLLEMSQEMLGDIIANGNLTKSLTDYIAHYTYFTREESINFAASIESVLQESAEER